MKSKRQTHTPGPWSIRPGTIDDDGCLTPMKLMDSADDICIAHFHAIPEDATLIAAAPEMLDQLRQCLLILRAIGKNAPTADLVADNVELVIAKAEGQQ